MSKRWEYRRTVFFEEELMDKIRKYGNEGWELCNIVESRREIFTSIPNSTITPVNVKIINDCIFKREIYVKPIEDKEPTAFQWSDELVTDIVMGTVEAVLKKEPIFLPHFINDFKKSKISQSIPAGKGTANETINEEGKSVFDILNEKHPMPPTLDRNKKERIEVTSIVQIKETALNSKEPNITFYLNQFAPVYKHEELKQAFEQIVNNEVFNIDRINERLDWLRETEELERKAFYNAHLMKGDRYVYNTFEDYKNSLK